MRRISKKHIMMAMVPIVMVGAIISVVKMSNNESVSLNHEFVIDMSEKNYRKVYLLDENKYLIPLSIDISNKEYLVDEIYTVVSNLRDLQVEGFTSVLAKDVKINAIELENGVLNIDFSKEFLVYQKDLEEKIIESLTWSVMDFEEVNGLTISVDGVKLEKMPISGLVLPSVLDKQIGINKYHDLVSNYSDSDSVVVMYQKELAGNTYYIPITRRIDRQDSDIVAVFKGIEKEIGVLSGVRKIDEISSLDFNNINCENDKVSVNLNSGFLIEDNLIDSNIYELLMVMFEYNGVEAGIDFYIDEESVEVNGYSTSDESKVSTIVFNEIDI